MASRLIYCQKLQQQAEGLTRVPCGGELGQRIYDNISKAAWQLWLQRQTMFINENRLAVRESATKEFLNLEMEKFFFTTVDSRPEGYIPQVKNDIKTT